MISQADGTRRSGEQRYRHLFEHAPICIFVIDLIVSPPAILELNRRAELVYGYPAAELAGLPAATLLTEEAMSEAQTVVQRVQQGQTVTIEAAHRRRDGTYFPVRVIAALDPTDASRMIVTVEDITAERQRRSEAEAVAADRLRIAQEIHDGVAQSLAGLRFKTALWSHLASLTTSSGALSPAFDPAVTIYNTTVSHATTDISLFPTAFDSEATISLFDDFGAFNYPVASGSSSPVLSLNVGANRFTVEVIARDGTSKELYTLIVSRQAADPTNADLASLTSSGGALSPLFSPGVSFYTLGVTDNVSSVTVTPSTFQAGATIEVKANDGSFSPVSSGATSAPLNLNPGTNTIELKVTAADGLTVKSYILIVTQFVDNLHWASKPGDAGSTNPSISSNGLFVAFSSNAKNLVAGDTNNREDVFVYDVTQKTIERVSVDNAGNQADHHSKNPSISADGRYVAFQSQATNLVPGDTNDNGDPNSFGQDIFVYDRDTNTIERVSLTDSGGQANGNAETPSISGDGRYVAFASSANNQVADFANGNVDVYIHDRETDSIVGIAVPFNIAANRDSLNPVFSEDGNYVAFEFSVDKSIESGNDGYMYRDIYLYNRATKTVQQLIEGNVGTDADGTNSRNPSISKDGRYVAFESNLASLDFYDSNNAVDVFVYDRITGLIQRVSLDSTGTEGTRESTKPSISGDGRFVAFESLVSTFVPADTNGVSDIFMKNLDTGEISRLSVNSASMQGDAPSATPALSFDGSSLAFQSGATNLDALDTNGATDVFVVVTAGLGPSSIAYLSSLTSDVDPLYPSFSAGVSSYSASAANPVVTALVKPVVAEAGATIELQVNAGGFSPLDSGTTSSPLPLELGANAVDIKGTAPDGSASKTYVLTVNRAFSSNAELSSLTLLADAFLALTPGFTGSTTVYTASVPHSITDLNVIPTAAQANATITVNGVTVASGATSSAINLTVGSNTITVLVTAEDGTTTKSYVVTVTRAPNTPPVADSQSVTVLQEQAELITLTGSDDDGNALTYSIMTQPALGTLTGLAPDLTYTPNPGVSGDDSFTFKVNDGTVDSPAATVTLSITANRPPVAVDDSALTIQGSTVTTITIEVLSNDSDPDGDPLLVTLNGQPGHGTAAVSGDRIAYTPETDFSGDDSFGYSVSDGKGGSATATVTVTVIGIASENPAEGVYLPVILRQ